MAKITIDLEKCKGCGLCCDVCPKKIVEIEKKKTNAKGYFTAHCTDDIQCMGCAMCAKMCPECAISVER